MKLKRFKYSPILGWSVSRYEVFQTCKRRYFYNYYAKYDSEFTREQIDFLKKLTTVPLEVGNIVHDIHKKLLERLQKTTQTLDSKRFDEYIYKLTKEYCENKTFAEIYYHQQTQIKINEIYEQVRFCVQNFLQSERFHWLFDKAIARSSEWLVEPDGYGETRINDLKAYCKVDFLFPVGDDDCYILDWKTGKPDKAKHAKQLAGYATWASYHFDAKPENIKSLVCYLSPEYTEVPVTVTEADIIHFAEQVKIETEEMYQHCTFVQENIPTIKSTFTLTENTKLCEYCNFRELCGR
ncbi:PD-(D/E)XK nuclease family protein [Candidatus Albibeggiatoa sp. nov. BB20]|uniref:RecB family exonuclease n=1 Tax=Candidatus Albibeggiatoa sp. nov. BB20 TaxID=3162723 RepID=UPI003365AE6F